MALTSGSTASLTMTANQSIVKNLGGVLSNPTIPAALAALNQQFSVGNAAGNFNFAWIGSRSVTSGTPDDIDLTSTLSALDGTTCNFADIVGLILSNPSNSGANLTIGNAAANAWSAMLGATGTAILLPGTTLMVLAPVAAGYTVDSTHKILRVTAASGTVTYSGWILGH